MTQWTTHAKWLVLVVAASAAAALSVAPAAAEAHDCSGFDGTCGAQFHTDGSVSGGKQVGDVVTCTAGEAHAVPGEPTYSGYFSRGSTPIPGAEFAGRTGTYTLTEADVGFHVACIARAHHPKGDAQQDAGWHGPIAARPPGPCRIERFGTNRSETVNGTAEGDRIFGLRGNDVLRGLGGDDCLTGDSGNDVLSGGSGDDSLIGGFGTDRLNGGPGNDTLKGGVGRDRINCGSGRDTARVDRRDIVRGCENVLRA